MIKYRTENAFLLSEKNVDWSSATSRALSPLAIAISAIFLAILFRSSTCDSEKEIPEMGIFPVLPTDPFYKGHPSCFIFGKEEQSVSQYSEL
jgi:hypothetical protein